MIAPPLNDLEAVKAMLVDAINSSIPPRYEYSQERDIEIELEDRYGNHDGPVIQCDDPHYSSPFDLNKLAATVLAWFAAREAEDEFTALCNAEEEDALREMGEGSNDE